ncbi:hypothetical protein B9T11_08580 [Wohlfahrtiimonas chitiniclastica]|nr:Com family DNA-binding transcriptional regulator [Wohlfahrtiimonas chitiniclastica]MBS7819021.1 Com family DNA-binding transcriptional regulator [Wohlfahrtiimonas chitiniclastica]MBS7822129.1 Com family DNA-binding transcriptional regulator [Wohlfahrtiimonas chitiniclastica]MBS7825546.1 Com family DNA-binding transcriptional regulator [Wohlfahrtiimonas chitiniclastica]MBS7829921.1 Com family DNA-binding transcriptional regulator [Wohlfahrtiimonas chitiniclastica]
MKKEYIRNNTEEIRCTHCNRKLCEAIYRLIVIKCPRCKTLNSLKKDPER